LKWEKFILTGNDAFSNVISDINTPKTNTYTCLFLSILFYKLPESKLYRKKKNSRKLQLDFVRCLFSKLTVQLYGIGAIHSNINNNNKLIINDKTFSVCITTFNNFLHFLVPYNKCLQLLLSFTNI
jgi:hypothetical protein